MFNFPGVFKKIIFISRGLRCSPIRLALGVLTYFVQRTGDPRPPHHHPVTRGHPGALGGPLAALPCPALLCFVSVVLCGGFSFAFDFLCLCCAVLCCACVVLSSPCWRRFCLFFFSLLFSLFPTSGQQLPVPFRHSCTNPWRSVSCDFFLLCCFFFLLSPFLLPPS